MNIPGKLGDEIVEFEIKESVWGMGTATYLVYTKWWRLSIESS